MTNQEGLPDDQYRKLRKRSDHMVREVERRAPHYFDTAMLEIQKIAEGHFGDIIIRDQENGDTYYISKRSGVYSLYQITKKGDERFFLVATRILFGFDGNDVFRAWSEETGEGLESVDTPEELLLEIFGFEFI